MSKYPTKPSLMGGVKQVIRGRSRPFPQKGWEISSEISNWSAIGANGPNWHPKAIVNETTSCNFNTFFNLKLPCWFMFFKHPPGAWSASNIMAILGQSCEILPKKSGSNSKKGCRWRDYSLVIHPEKSPQVPKSPTKLEIVTGICQFSKATI